MKIKFNFSGHDKSSAASSAKVSPDIKKQILTCVIVLVAAFVVICGVLGVAANLLDNIAANNSQQALYEEMEKTLPADSYEKTEHELEFAEEVKTVFEAKSEGELVGYFVQTIAKGYKNPIELLCAINPDGAVVKVTILSAEETIGYGRSIEDKSFLSSFEGKSKELTLVRAKTDAEDKISAVSGATVSSNAVKDGVNHSIAAVSQIRAEVARLEAEAAEKARIEAEKAAAEKAAAEKAAAEKAAAEKAAAEKAAAEKAAAEKAAAEKEEA